MDINMIDFWVCLTLSTILVPSKHHPMCHFDLSRTWITESHLGSSASHIPTCHGYFQVTQMCVRLGDSEAWGP